MADAKRTLPKRGENMGRSSSVCLSLDPSTHAPLGALSKLPTFRTLCAFDEFDKFDVLGALNVFDASEELDAWMVDELEMDGWADARVCTASLHAATALISSSRRTRCT